MTAVAPSTPDLTTFLALSANAGVIVQSTREPIAQRLESIASQYETIAKNPNQVPTQQVARVALGELFRATATSVRDQGIIAPLLVGLIAAYLPEARSK